MITNPATIKFESTKDIVDYISRGLPPSRKNYEAIIYAMNHPVDEIPQDPAGQVYICKDSIANWSNSEYVQSVVNDILAEVYKNRIRERNIAIAVGVGAAAIVVGCMFAGGSNKDK